MTVTARWLQSAELVALRPEDLEAAVMLSTREGWNQTAADWRRLLGLGPGSCFGARIGSHLLGTVTTMTYGRDLGWVGMMVVHPGFRRRGIGAALMRMALDHLERRVVRVGLDATPAGRALYESLGFSMNGAFVRWQGTAHVDPEPAVSVGFRLAPVGPRQPNGSWPALLDLDRIAYGADRSRLLELLVADSPCEPLAALAEDGRVVGYVFNRPGRLATIIGPLVATDSNVADHLLHAMVRRWEGRDIALDVHEAGVLGSALLASCGLKKRREISRMQIGDWSEVQHAIGASAGPELG